MRSLRSASSVSKPPKKLVDLPPKPLHEQVDFSNELPDRFEKSERRVIDEPYWDDDDEHRYDHPIFGFDD